jgi:hypothetical protein
MKTTYKVGDTFWLIVSPYNPIAIQVKVLEVVPDQGYWVDEPVGLVSQPNCVCETKEKAADILRVIHKGMGAEAITSVHKWDLEGLRSFMLMNAKKTNHPHASKVVSGVYPPKEEGTEWFKLKEFEFVIQDGVCG